MSVILSLEKTDSISEKSSLGEVAPLIKRRKARSLESGEEVIRLVPEIYIHGIACRTCLPEYSQEFSNRRHWHGLYRADCQ